MELGNELIKEKTVTAEMEIGRRIGLGKSESKIGEKGRMEKSQEKRESPRLMFFYL